jgi:hypothetical protein
MSARKGMFNVEYVAVLIIFIAFSAYFTFRLTGQRPAYVREVRKEIFRSENYLLSEVLINDIGEPSNWNTLVGGAGQGNIRRLGLLDQSENLTNRLSRAKVIALYTLCNNSGYGTVRGMMGANHNFSITVEDSSTGTLLANCTSAANPEALATIKRIVAFDNGGWGYVQIQSWN